MAEYHKIGHPTVVLDHAPNQRIWTCNTIWCLRHIKKERKAEEMSNIEISSISEESAISKISTFFDKHGEVVVTVIGVAINYLALYCWEIGYLAYYKVNLNLMSVEVFHGVAFFVFVVVPCLICYAIRIVVETRKNLAIAILCGLCILFGMVLLIFTQDSLRIANLSNATLFLIVCFVAITIFVFLVFFSIKLLKHWKKRWFMIIPIVLFAIVYLTGYQYARIKDNHSIIIYENQEYVMISIFQDNFIAMKLYDENNKSKVKAGEVTLIPIAGSELTPSINHHLILEE